jgi:hypothetical protein
MNRLDRKGGTHVLLKLDLQDGFEEDIVIIKIDSKELYHKEGVKTELTLGYADSIEAEVPEGQCTVEVTLPERGISESIHLKIMAPVYLGLSVLDGKIVYRLSNTFFAYL